MSLEQSIQSIVSKLDQLSTRLANIESKLGSSSSSSAPSSSPSSGESGVPQKVQDYLDNVFTPNIPQLLDIAQQLGGQTNTAAQKFANLLSEHEKLLTIAAQSKKPSDADFAKLLTPTFTLIQELGELAGSTRGTNDFLFTSSLAEAAGALTWTQHSLPAPFIKEMIGASQFHSNKILREFKGVDETKVGFVNALNGYLKSLEEFVRKVHTTGLVWNPNGGDALSLSSSVQSSTPSPAPSGGPQGGPPGPPPPAPKLEPSTSSSSDDTRSSLLAALNQGEGITSRLKKVTDDMKAKNRKDRTGVVTAKTTTTAKKTAQKFPPKFQLEGSKWVLDYITDQVTVDINETKESVSLYKTDGAMIRINGKFNGLVIDSCRKTTIVFDEAISSCQLINCSSVKIQVLGTIPSISIDKTSGCHVYLSKDSINTQIITSKCDECNVLIQEGEDWVEFPVPEQFLSVVVDGKLKTESVAHIGD